MVVKAGLFEPGVKERFEHQQNTHTQSSIAEVGVTVEVVATSQYRSRSRHSMWNSWRAGPSVIDLATTKHRTGLY
jgi:hypothetical protein